MSTPVFVIDGYFLITERPVGLHRFSTEILRELDESFDCSNIVIAVPAIDKVYMKFKNIKIVEICPRTTCFGKIGLKVWEKFVYPLYVTRKKGISVDLSYARQLLKCDICGAFDCIVFNCPQNFQGFKERITRVINARRIVKSAHKAKKVITLSEDAKKNIIEYTKIQEEKIVIIGCGWQHIDRIKCDDSILKKLPDGFSDYYFALGSRYYHKNIKWIIKAAEQNPSEHFIITGAQFQKTNDIDRVLPENIYYTGYLSDEEIKSLLTHCKAFIQPSFYEGFGIPPLEALAVGVPIIVSNTSCLPEVYGNSAHYIDPYNYENINLKQILSTPVQEANNTLCRFSWKKSAEIFYNMLQEWGSEEKKYD